MKSTKLALQVFVLVLLAVGPCLAGVTYTAKTKSEAQGKTEEGVMRGTVNGEKGKIVWEKSSTPVIPTGAYLLTKDGAKTLYLVDPSTKTYVKWDTGQMMQDMGGAMSAMRGMGVKMQFEEPKVEKLLEENGGVIAGLPTKHYRFKTTYRMTMTMPMGIGNRSVNNERIEDLWTTNAVADVGMKMWAGAPFKTGDPEFDKVIAAERSKATGMVLKSVSVTTTNAGGRPQTNRDEMEITDLKSGVPVADSTFELPEGYKEQQMAAPGRNPDTEEEEQ
jgi:hypothetical protein